MRSCRPATAAGNACPRGEPARWAWQRHDDRKIPGATRGWRQAAACAGIEGGGGEGRLAAQAQTCYLFKPTGHTTPRRAYTALTPATTTAPPPSYHSQDDVKKAVWAVGAISRAPVCLAFRYHCLLPHACFTVCQPSRLASFLVHSVLPLSASSFLSSLLGTSHTPSPMVGISHLYAFLYVASLPSPTYSSLPLMPPLYLPYQNSLQGQEEMDHGLSTLHGLLAAHGSACTTTLLYSCRAAACFAAYRHLRCLAHAWRGLSLLPALPFARRANCLVSAVYHRRKPGPEPFHQWAADTLAPTLLTSNRRCYFANRHQTRVVNTCQNYASAA